MSEAKIADKKPAVLELEAGTYWWCSCGQSATQPFCDGAHKGSDFAPEKFVVAEKQTVAFCQCKRSAQGVRCDGTHSKL